MSHNCSFGDTVGVCILLNHKVHERRLHCNPRKAHISFRVNESSCEAARSSLEKSKHIQREGMG